MRDRLYVGAAQVLLLAIITAMAMAIFALTFPEGKQAMVSFGGLEPAKGTKPAIQYAYTLDTLFPIFYGSGLILLLTALSGRQNRPLARLLILATLIASAADLVENAYIFGHLSDADPLPVFVAMATALKYGLLALVSVGLSVLLPTRGGLIEIIRFILRVVMPIAVALMFSKLGGEAGSEFTKLLAVGGFTVLLAGMAWIAWNERIENRHEPQNTTANTPKGVVSSKPVSSLQPAAKPAIQENRASATIVETKLEPGQRLKPVTALDIPLAKEKKLQSSANKSKKAKKRKSA